jgi:hypothetical protein
MPNVEWWERPVEKAQDRRDPEEHDAVAAASAGLPADHPAREAYASGADTIALTHVVGATSYTEVVEALKAAYLEGYRRQLRRGGSSFRP